MRRARAEMGAEASSKSDAGGWHRRTLVAARLVQRQMHDGRPESYDGRPGSYDPGIYGSGADVVGIVVASGQPDSKDGLEGVAVGSKRRRHWSTQCRRCSSIGLMRSA
ncbi:hypothetical protein ACLOJK_024115 [Asimina triloba]